MEKFDDLNTLKDTLLNDDIPVTNPETILSFRFQQYQAYLQLADKIIERRQAANSFFLTTNTGVCIVVAYLFSKDVAAEIKPFFWFILVAGILLSYFWLRMVYTYRQLSSGKFRVINSMEKFLPFAPFKAEWIALGEGRNKKLYNPLTNLEIWIPRLFIMMYSGLILYFSVYKLF